MLMPDQQASELTKPCVGSLHDPTANIAPQFTSILVAPFLVVLPVGRNQFNPSLLQALTQRVGVVAAVGDHALRLLPRTAFPAWDPDFGECGFRKRNFTGGGTFQPNSQRKTLTVDQYHPLRPLAPLGFTDRETPFFAGTKLPSIKDSSNLSRPCSASAPSSAKATDARPARSAPPRRFAEATECRRNNPGSMPRAGLDCPAVAWAGAAWVPPTPTAHPSTASAVSS